MIIIFYSFFFGVRALMLTLVATKSVDVKSLTETFNVRLKFGQKLRRCLLSRRQSSKVKKLTLESKLCNVYFAVGKIKRKIENLYASGAEK